MTTAVEAGAEIDAGALPTDLILTATLELGESLAFGPEVLPALTQRDDLVVVAGAFAVTGIDRPSGTIRWQRDVVADSVSFAGRLCLAIWAEHVTALVADDGTELWSRQVRSEVLAVAHDGERILLGLRDGGALSLDPATGRSPWPASEPLDPDQPYLHGQAAEGAVVDGCFVWRRGLGELAAVDAATGAPARVPDIAGRLRPWTYEVDWGRVPEGWSKERRFADGRVGLLSSGWLTDDQPGRVVIDQSGGAPEVLDLPEGYSHTDTCLAADALGITVVAQTVGDEQHALHALIYRPR
ncbi:PQQ-binding-like beta-propeller repeat protein [Aquihabitans daechungensis]|uniref:outer membrane protein assembly factor BamB family protein n=1 Tax=Aquihabitans daechungensis TaxID=1052257 RepID=UPI003B9F3E3E